MLRPVGIFVLVALVVACRDEPPPAPPAERPAASAEEVTAVAPLAADASANQPQRYATPTPTKDLQGPLLDSVDVGRAVYPLPSAEELESSGQIVTVAENRTGGNDFGEGSPCKLELLRGWLRVTCDVFLPSVSVLGGSVDGLYLAASEGTATITMALAPGDRRVLQLSRGGGSYGTAEVSPSAVISETWIGTTAPHVAISPPSSPQTFY